jgi:phosphate transport system substrate-binding protein
MEALLSLSNSGNPASEFLLTRRWFANRHCLRADKDRIPTLRFLGRSCVVFCILFFLTACGSNSSHARISTTTITDIGSDTIVNLALAWAESYSASHPDIQISVSGGGSGTGISALINKTTDLANASRAMSADEIKNARKNGVEPKQLIIARDAIAVIVHPSNPIQRITLQQLSDIFTGKINNWKSLGGEDRPIVRVSRETNSGTHVYFLETVIRLGSKTDKSIFSADTLLLPSSEGIMAEVSQNPNAIGYDGLGYVLPSVKTLAVGSADSGPFTLPAVATVQDHSYLISRDLYMYTNGDPQGILKQYLEWILSPEAQKIVANLGFIPIQ